MSESPPLESEKNALEWCEAQIARDQENRNMVELQKLFESATKKNWQTVAKTILSIDPVPLSEQDVLNFCRHELQRMPHREINKAALEQSYILAAKLDWVSVKNFFSTHKDKNLVDKNIPVVGPDIQEPRSGIRPRR